MLNNVNDNKLKIDFNNNIPNTYKDFKIFNDKKLIDILFKETLIEFINYKNKSLGNIEYYNPYLNEIKLSGNNNLTKNIDSEYLIMDGDSDAFKNFELKNEKFLSKYDMILFFYHLIAYLRINIKIVNYNKLNNYEEKINLSLLIKDNIYKKEEILIYLLVDKIFNNINNLNMLSTVVHNMFLTHNSNDDKI